MLAPGSVRDTEGDRLREILLVGIGGFVGAVARYVVSGAVQQHADGTFPAGTLAVNVLGCGAIGGLMALVEEGGALSPDLRLLLLVGLLGSFTTFSTFGHETLALLREGDLPLSVANVGGNVVLGLLAVFAGRALARWFAG